MARPLSEIAREARTDLLDKGGARRFPYLWPYLEAMLELESINSSYYNDTAKSVVLYFLSNASTWRGDKARAIKAELREMTK